MTPLQTLEVRQGEVKIRLAELGGMAELTEETRAELDTLRTEYTDTERRMAALRLAEPDRTPIIARTAPRAPNTARCWNGPTWAPSLTF